MDLESDSGPGGAERTEIRVSRTRLLINLRVTSDASLLRIVQGGLTLGSTVAAACGMMELAVGGVALAIPGTTLMSAVHDTFEPGKNLFTDELVSLQSDWRHYYGPTQAA